MSSECVSDVDIILLQQIHYSTDILSQLNPSRTVVLQREREREREYRDK